MPRLGRELARRLLPSNPFQPASPPAGGPMAGGAVAAAVEAAAQVGPPDAALYAALKAAMAGRPSDFSVCSGCPGCSP
jgi:hypothetical protein